MIDNYIELSRVCGVCGKRRIFQVNESDYRRWKDGASIQDAFPYLSADVREHILTGTCSECWDYLFREKSCLKVDREGQE